MIRKYRLRWGVSLLLVFAFALYQVNSHAAMGIRTAADIGIESAASLGVLGSRIGLFHVVGLNLDVDSPQEAIWEANDLPTLGAGPEMCFLNIGDSADPVFISSDDASDAGKVVRVKFLNQERVGFESDVVLGTASSGTGTVFTQIGTQNILRVNQAIAIGSKLAGNIYIHIDPVDAAIQDGVPDVPLTDIVTVIRAGSNQTRQACFSVPVGTNALIFGGCAINAMSIGPASSTLIQILHSVSDGPLFEFGIALIPSNETFCFPTRLPGLIPEKSDLEWVASGSFNHAATLNSSLLFFPTTF